jgi:acyl carrier protein
MSTNIEHRIRSIVSRVTKVPLDVASNRDLFRELGVKSAAALELLLSLEDEFAIAIPDEEFGDARTLSKMVHLISQLQGAIA